MAYNRAGKTEEGEIFADPRVLAWFDGRRGYLTSIASKPPKRRARGVKNKKLFF